MNSKIRVAFWHNVFAPYRVPLFQRLAAYDDIDLTVYYGSSKDRYRQWEVEFGEDYQHVELPYISIPFYPHKFNHTLLPKLLRRNYDVYIAVENEIGCQLAYLAKLWTRTPLILWSIQMDYLIVRDSRDYQRSALLRKLPGFLGRKLQALVFFPLHYGAAYVKSHADAYLAAGLETEKHLISAGARGPFFRFGNAVDSETFRQRLQQHSASELKQNLGIEGKTVILSVSYLQKRKGVQYLIEAFLRLHHLDAVLVIVGDGEYKPELLKLLPEGREDILFVGHDENTAQYYAIADIFAMPSFSDPWGLTVNEAMLAGLPVITTSNIGAQELIQGNGYVIPPRESSSLETALQKLLDDPELRAEMGRRSQEIIKTYTIEHTAETCRDAIYAVLRHSSGREKLHV